MPKDVPLSRDLTLVPNMPAVEKPFQPQLMMVEYSSGSCIRPADRAHVHRLT